MPLENFPPGSPSDWLRHAHSDLGLAGARDSQDVLLETLCFHAQQDAEKALKALLVYKGIAVPKTHNIRTLLDILSSDVSIPKNLEEAAILTNYAVTSCYPGEYEQIGDDEYIEAIRLAKNVIRWVEEQISV
jgi:HEPN domain-containing protein